jgi:hypothetical protein
VSHAVDELWSVAAGLPHVDADALASAVEAASHSSDPLDYRTRLLIRDSLRALEARWGHDDFHQWLSASPYCKQIERARDPECFDKDPAEIGFPSLARRVVDVTKPETVIEFFRVLSRHVRQPTRLNVGGSIALMLRGLLSRQTEDVDIVNEVPAELRNQHDILHQLVDRFGLQLAHFQSHYLPGGWEHRLRSFEVFNDLEVFLVDPYDVMTSKLCSKRAKDLDDLRAMKAHIDRENLKSRVVDAGKSLMVETKLREAAIENWYILFGEQLSV